MQALPRDPWLDELFVHAPLDAFVFFVELHEFRRWPVNGETLFVSCPYCGEAADLEIDIDGGARQRYVQDCPVCCQPWNVSVTRDRDGDWSAELKTADE